MAALVAATDGLPGTGARCVTNRHGAGGPSPVSSGLCDGMAAGEGTPELQQSESGNQACVFAASCKAVSPRHSSTTKSLVT